MAMQQTLNNLERDVWEGEVLDLHATHSKGPLQLSSHFSGVGSRMQGSNHPADGGPAQEQSSIGRASHYPAVVEFDAEALQVNYV